jgi:hypothetical protein
MPRAGIKFAILLLIAFVAVNAQCVALCAMGNCPHPADATPHSHCPHHKSPRETPHTCAPQQPFFAKGSSELISAPVLQAGAMVSQSAPVVAPLLTDIAAVGSSPPKLLASPSLFVLRI